jgi:type II secretion system protein N
MSSKRNIFFYLGAVGWFVLVMALVIYMFFPYQKALRIALQNTAAGGRAAVSMEGVTMKLMGIKASKILFRPDSSTEGTAPFELSNVEISWNPLSLLKGKVTIYSKAALYGGMLRCTVEGVSFIGPSDPRISLKFDHVNLGKCPEGAFPWFTGMSGTLDGTMNKQTPMDRPERGTGVFRLDIKDGEIKGIQVKNMPKLIIPYKEIIIEGKIDGPRRSINRLALNSDMIAIAGAGVVQSGETDQDIDMKLSYRALSKSFPLQGSGTLTVSGSPAAPVVAVSPPETPKPGPAGGTLSRPGGALAGKIGL